MTRRKGLLRWLLSVGLWFAVGYLIAVLLRSASSSGALYRGNEGNLVFHDPSCRFFNAPTSVVGFNSREAAVAAGYQPCKLCRP